MKIRTGFVSNSSSSSFVAWGVEKSLIEFGDAAYLSVFMERLANLEAQKTESNPWYLKYYINEHKEMVEIEAEGREAMVAYAKDNMEVDYDKDDFRCGGSENDFVGIEPTTISKNHPEWTFGEVRKKVAEELNKTFDGNFTENDVSYYEEGWMDN